MSITYKKYNSTAGKNIRKECIKLPVFILISCAFMSHISMAGEFVPFVIPAKPNTDSLIAVSSFEPITTDSGRLRANGHFYRKEKRVRLWGVNLSFGANLPKHSDAPYIAARMAAAGINTVRCHHMDTARWPRGLWNAENGKTISPQALDRLDYFIDQLARYGIYVNINLHVGRAHSEYLGLPKANRQYDKISNIFTPALIDAQKNFARELLNHINPYRKVRYADDPAVAIVEITNENSLFMWDNENTLRTLPPYYSDILQNKYNNWLKKHYNSDEKLLNAWSKDTEQLGKNLLANGNLQTTVPDKNIPKDWNMEQHSGCKFSASRRLYRTRNALHIEIDKSDDIEWHLQFNQRNITVKAGQYYTVVFEAASEEPRQTSCSISQAHSPWSNLGLSRQVELNQKWQKFRFGFVAKDDDENARLSFAFGGSKIPFYLANVEFRPGGQVSLKKGESLQDSSVAVFADNESQTRTLDRMLFLAETEKAYFDEMRNFIKKDLGCKALVTGTIVFGPLGLYAQSNMDFIDTHAYWQHPRFPGRPWDRNNWLVEQKPMTNHPDEATLFRLAAERLLDKPFTVSEYNHPAPLDSQAECVPMIASFAAAQDWDGVWLYTYSHSSDEWNRENLNSYFDIDSNPAKWGFMRAGAAIFLDRTISPLGGFIYNGLGDADDLASSLAKLHLKYDRNMFGAFSERLKVTRDDMLKCQFVAALSGSYGHRDIIGPSAKLNWSIENGKGFYIASGRCASVYTGYAERFEKATDRQISIAAPNFVAVTVTALDKKPWISLEQSQKILVTACGRCENTGMKFSKDRRTVGREWGHGPVRVEAVKGTIEIPGGNWRCHALGPDGLAKANVPVRSEDGRNYIDILPEYKTMWYLLHK